MESNALESTVAMITTGGICALGIIFMLIYVLVFLVSIAGTIFWIVMLVDVIKREESDFPSKAGDNQKLLWLLIVILGGTIGAIVYYFMVYRKKK
jgi:hypothetical protein